MRRTYGDIVAGRLTPQPNHVAGYAEHRRQSGEPTEGVRPPGILVAEVRNRRPLHQVEDEHSLEGYKLHNTEYYCKPQHLIEATAVRTKQMAGVVMVQQNFHHLVG